MNVFRFELKSLSKGIFGWCLTLCCVLALYLSIFPMFRSSGFDAAALFARFPETLQSLFGMSDMDVSRLTGYLPFTMKLTQEVAAVGGLMLGTAAVTHDVRSKSADFLYAKPIARTHILAAKSAAVFTAGAILLVILTAVTGMLTAMLSPGEVGFASIVVTTLITVMLFWLYGAAGLMLGVLVPRIRGTAAIAIGSMFFFHIVFSICKVVTKDANGLAARILVPVNMFDRNLAATQARLEAPFVLLWAAEVCVLLLVSFTACKRNDIVV